MNAISIEIGGTNLKAARVDGAGDRDAREARERAVHAQACGIVSLVNCFDPETVVLGGGISKAGGAPFAPLRAEVDTLEWRPTGEPLAVVPAALREWAGAVGAARFATGKAGQEQMA